MHEPRGTKCLYVKPSKVHIRYNILDWHIQDSHIQDSRTKRRLVWPPEAVHVRVLYLLAVLENLTLLALLENDSRTTMPLSGPPEATWRSSWRRGSSSWILYTAAWFVNLAYMAALLVNLVYATWRSSWRSSWPPSSWPQSRRWRAVLLVAAVAIALVAAVAVALPVFLFPPPVKWPVCADARFYRH